MKTIPLEIPEEHAEAVFKALKAQFEPENVNPEKWENIKTFEDACKVVKPSLAQMTVLSLNDPDKDVLACQAVMKLTIVSRAMNKLANDGKEWKPDWSDSSEYKYYPWLKYKAGSGFSDYDYVCDRTYTDVGSRLCFKTRAMAEHSAKHFKQLYNEFFTL